MEVEIVRLSKRRCAIRKIEAGLETYWTECGRHTMNGVEPDFRDFTMGRVIFSSRKLATQYWMNRILTK